MNSIVRNTLLCVALTIPGLALAQTAEPAAPAAPAAPTPVTAPAAPAADSSTTAATDTPAQAPAAQSAKPTPSGKVAAPPEGKGEIVFFRPSKFTGAAITFKVREGEKELGKLNTGRYFVSVVDPGTHTYNVHTEAKDSLTLEVEAGEIYYVEGTITMGFMVGHANIAPSDQATFDSMAAKLKPAE